MHPLLNELALGAPMSGEVRVDAPRFLRVHDCPKTAEHSARVAREARQIAVMAGGDEDRAELAGWLHDISAVIPARDRADTARELGIEVLAEEDAFPLIVHQKLSAVVAREIFGIQDVVVLRAIGCHTTLRANPSRLDQVLFIADKVAWDQTGTPPYLPGLLAALQQSLDAATRYYLDYTWQRRDTLTVIHPWLRDAYEQFAGANRAEESHVVPPNRDRQNGGAGVLSSPGNEPAIRSHRSDEERYDAVDPRGPCRGGGRRSQARL